MPAEHGEHKGHGNVPGCAKIPYPNLIAAELALRAIKQRCENRGQKAPTGAYLCGPCRRWHLTSKSASQTPPWRKRTDPAVPAGEPGRSVPG